MEMCLLKRPFKVAKEMLALSVVLMILMIMDVAFLLREKRKESLYGTPNAAISDEIYDSAHLFENSCRFAWVEDEEPSLKKYVRHLMAPHCDSSVKQVHTRHIDGSFTRNSGFENATCIATEIVGGLRNDSRAHESTRREQIRFMRFYVNADVFRISCYDFARRPISAAVFAGLRDKSSNDLVINGQPQIPSPKIFDSRNISISILAFDSMSRSQFGRHMKKSTKQMKKMGFVTFHGYNKVGDNSNVNFLPIIAHQLREGLRHPMFDADGDINVSRFYPNSEKIDPDSIDFLWKEMRQKGCVTLFNDDIMHTSRGLFHYPSKAFLHGFLNEPTDHYYRAYYLQIYSELLNSARDCYHGNFLQAEFLNIWFRFLMTYSDRCHFSFSFLTSISHDNPNDIEKLDRALYESLKRLEESEALENTVLIIMGDHGNRVTRLSRTFAGRLEERQPLMSMRFPKQFGIFNPGSMQNIFVNTQRYISNFDVHETLFDIIQGQFGVERTNKRGISLFKPIPLDRSCVDNNVVHNFCLCMEVEPKADRSTLDVSLMDLSLKNYLSKFPCVAMETMECRSEVDVRVPNEMVRMRMRSKGVVPKRENYGVPSSYEYIYRNCTTANHRGDLLDITVQYRFDREESYDIVYPPMVVAHSGPCRHMRNAAAYCRCMEVNTA